MIEFFRTGMGQKFYEHTMPGFVKQLERLNENLERIASQMACTPSICQVPSVVETSSAIRAAVYTRKAASRDGVDWNAAKAQRDACASFIRERGWVLVDERYDDMGFSGVKLDRPGLTRLLADADSKRIDAIVVRSVDRLSRSLPDCVRLLERLRSAGCTVAVASGEVVFDASTVMPWRSFL